jgi:hypothetical protein
MYHHDMKQDQDWCRNLRAILSAYADISARPKTPIKYGNDHSAA